MMRNLTLVASLIFMLSTEVHAKNNRGKRLMKCPSKGGSKFLICHTPPGKPEKQNLLAVGSEESVEDHLAHGDRVGPCADSKYDEVKEYCGICDVDVEPGGC